MDTNEKSLVVCQSNELVEASYKIASIGEGRLIRMLIAQIRPGDQDFKTYRIDVEEFARFFGISKESNSVYEQVQKSARSLREREIFIKNGKSWFSTGWLSHAEYIEGSGYIEVSFHAKLKPYLLGLQKYFTKYELKNIVNFRSGYSMRIFEFLKQEEFKANRNGYFNRYFEYDELRELLGIEKKEYAFFKDFRVRVIDSSVREINANPDIRITNVEYIKTGRKFSHIVFHCEKAKQLQLDVDEPLPKLEAVETPKPHPDYIAELIAIGIDEQTAYRWKRKYSVARLREAIAYTKAMQKAGKIRDSVTGFLSRAVADNIGASWVEEQKKQEAEKVKREQIEKEKQRAEDMKLAQERKEREEVFMTFDGLPEEEKNTLRTLFEEQLEPSSLWLWKRAKERNPTHPEKEAIVKASFIRFFKAL